MILLKNKNKFLAATFVFLFSFISAHIYAQTDALNKNSSEKIQEENQQENKEISQSKEDEAPEDEIVAAFKKSEAEKKRRRAKRKIFVYKEKVSSRGSATKKAFF